MDHGASTSKPKKLALLCGIVTIRQQDYFSATVKSKILLQYSQRALQLLLQESRSASVKINGESFKIGSSDAGQQRPQMVQKTTTGKATMILLLKATTTIYMQDQTWFDLHYAGQWEI